MGKVEKFVERRRIELKMTQTDLGIVLGFGAKTGGQLVSNKARGIEGWPRKYYPALCRILKISRADLMEQFMADRKTEFDSIFEKKKA